MLPEYRRRLIIMILAIIGIIIVVIAMYNLSKYVRGQDKLNEGTVYDDPYPEEYLYYGFIIDEDNNYQLMGIDKDFKETELGLRSFLPMRNLYFYNKHLVIYTDAINQINYNAAEKTFNFFELNPFYSNDTQVLLADNYFIFYHDNVLEYCSVEECNKTVITDSLVSDAIFVQNDRVFYELNDGVYEFNLDTLKSNHIMIPDYLNDIELLAVDEERLIFLNGENYYAYQLDNSLVVDLSTEIKQVDSGEISFVALHNDSFVYKTKDSSGNIVLKEYIFLLHEVSNYSYNLGNEDLSNAFEVTDNLLYAELSTEESIRYVLINTEDWVVACEFANPYVVLIGV